MDEEREEFDVKGGLLIFFPGNVGQMSRVTRIRATNYTLDTASRIVIMVSIYLLRVGGEFRMFLRSPELERLRILAYYSRDRDTRACRDV